MTNPTDLIKQARKLDELLPRLVVCFHDPAFDTHVFGEWSESMSKPHRPLTQDELNRLAMVRTLLPEMADALEAAAKNHQALGDAMGCSSLPTFEHCVDLVKSYERWRVRDRHDRDELRGQRDTALAEVERLKAEQTCELMLPMDESS